MSTVNERLRGQNTVLIIWLTAAINKLGGTLEMTGAGLDAIAQRSAAGTEVLHSQELEGGKIVMKVIDPTPKPEVPANGASAPEAPAVIPLGDGKPPVV
jgi:hypothetical protein